MMRLNKREKFLLTILVGTITIIGFYQFIITPINLTVDELRLTLEEKDLEFHRKQRRAQQEPVLQEDKQKITSEILSTASRFYGVLEQEDVIIILNDLLIQNAFEMNTMNFTQPTTESFGFSGKEEEEATEDNFHSVELNKLVAQTNYTASYGGIMDALRLLESYEHNVMLNSLSMTGTPDGSITGTATYHFFNIPSIKRYYPGRPETVTYSLLKDGLLEYPENPFDTSGMPMPTTTTTTTITGEDGENFDEDRDTESSIIDRELTDEELIQMIDQNKTTSTTIKNDIPLSETQSASFYQQIRNRSIEKESEWLLTVVKGDTLYHITMAFYGERGKIHYIIEANNIHDPSLIYIGDVLRIPKL